MPSPPFFFLPGCSLKQQSRSSPSVSPVPTQAHQEAQCLLHTRLMKAGGDSEPWPLLTMCRRLCCCLFYKDSPCLPGVRMASLGRRDQGSTAVSQGKSQPRDDSHTESYSKAEGNIFPLKLARVHNTAQCTHSSHEFGEIDNFWENSAPVLDSPEQQ